MEGWPFATWPGNTTNTINNVEKAARICGSVVFQRVVELVRWRAVTEEFLEAIDERL